MVYRFTIISDEVEDFMREIKIEADATFLELHKLILSSCGYNDEQLTSAYVQRVAEMNDSLPPYLSVEMKVNKTEIKNLQKTEGILPAGAEIVENFTLQIK